jgi:hypothetical protein
MGDADRQFLKITFVRDPLEHIISHLRFAEHYSRPELKAAYDGMLSPEVRDVVDRLARVDFACSEAMIETLETLPPKGVELFDNCQSRYFWRAARMSRASPIRSGCICASRCSRCCRNLTLLVPPR